MTDAAAIAAALALVAAGAQHPPGPWILTCNMAGPGEDQNGPKAHRMFRIGPHLFEAWNPEKKAFGRNLCVSFSCVGSKDRLEGVISSPTLSLTVTLDPATGQASWRALGASNLKTTNGPCTARPDEAGPKTAG